MRIEIGTYLLTNGAKDFVVAVSTGKFDKEGKETSYQHSYHPTLESALSNILKRKILKSEATTLLELKKEIRKFRKLITKYLDLEIILE